MMAGVLITSILSGNLITRFGRYRPFPIAGTALMAVGLYLLSRLSVTTPTWVAAVFMLVLGLGLGMVMQVLVLAVQNAVDYRFLGVATSSSTLFRQVGGSIGVSVFGAIFANQLGDELGRRLPAAAHVPAAANPAIVRSLPAAIHAPYVASFAASLRPVFVAATGVAVVAFILTWLLREVPLRQTARAEGVGESFASPRDDSSERELERIAGSLMRGETRTRIYQRMIDQSDLAVTPGEAWLLARLRDRAPTTLSALAAALDVPQGRLEPLAAALDRRGLIRTDSGALGLTAEGRAAVGELVEAGRAELTELLRNWQRPDDQELAPVIRRLAASLVAGIPAEPDPLGS
jgi:MFS family permease